MLSRLLLWFLFKDPGKFSEQICTKWRKKEEKPVAVEKKVSENKTSYHRTKQQRAEEVKIKNRIKALEKEIEELEGKKKKAEEQLSLPDVVSDYRRLNELCSEIKAMDEAIEAKYAEWEELNS